jgi:integrase
MEEKPKPKGKPGRKVTTHTPGLFKRKVNKRRADGSIYEYEGEIWHMCYQVPDPERPKKTITKFESCRTKSKTAANDLLTKRRAAVLAQTTPSAVINDITFRSYVIDHYLKKNDTLKLRGLDRHKQVLREICGGIGDEQDKKMVEKTKNPYALDRIKMSEITAKRVEQYLGAKRERNNADTTCNRHLSAIRKIVKLACKDELATKVQVDEMDKLTQSREDNCRINYLRLSQIPLLLGECEKKGAYLRQVVEFALATGIRRGRVYRLEWSMLDIEHSRISIPKDKNGDAFEAPLGERAMKVLKERKEARNPESPYVFYDPDTLTNWTDLKKSFQSAVKNTVKEAIRLKLDTAGLDGFVFHDLRHSFVSHLVMSGVPITTVKELAGHRRIATTMRYAHLDPNTLKKGVALLPY